MNDKSSQKVANKKYICINCDYLTCKLGNYNKHCLTAKHKKMTSDDKKVAKACSIFFYCECGNNYKYRQGLFNHKKKCNYESHILENPVSDIKKNDKNIVNNMFIMEMFKENQEFKTLLIEQCKQTELQQQQMFILQKENNNLINKMVEISQNSLTIPTIINNSNNSNNNTTNNNQFNLNVFLNETCKNAINFSEFIDNIQVTYDDLENNAKMGFVDGMTKIIIDNLKQLEFNNRPIHCTDIKRETIYVKEVDQWEKDTSKDTIQKGIQEITRKNMCQLSEWREDNPEYDDMETKTGELSIIMQQNSMAGGKREVFYPKIIKNIAKGTIIEKTI